MATAGGFLELQAAGKGLARAVRLQALPLHDWAAEHGVQSTTIICLPVRCRSPPCWPVCHA